MVIDLAKTLEGLSAAALEAVKNTEYKYFGDYELSDDQWEAVDTLVEFARIVTEHLRTGQLIVVDHPQATSPVDDRGGAVCEQQVVEVPRGIIAFLKGSAPLKGVWFGDKHPTEQGAFWWRKYLPALGDEA